MRVLKVLLIVLCVSNISSHILQEVPNDTVFVYKDFSYNEFCQVNDGVLQCGDRNIGKKIHFASQAFDRVKLSLNFSTVLEKGKLLVGKEKMIVHLHFNNNSITYVEKEMFDDFISLKGLNFDHTKLRIIDETFLTKTLGSHLIILNLANNEISTISTSAFKFMENLATLDLGRNQEIGKIINTGIFGKSLTKLGWLYLEDCNITYLADNVFVNLISLTNLFLSHNPLTSIPKAINLLPKLYHFSFGNSSITSFHRDSEVHNKAVGVFALFYSPTLRYVDDCAFCNFPNLWSIDLSSSANLSSIHKNAFGTEEDMPELADIKMKFCNLSTIPSSRLTRKAHIYIQGNPIIDISTFLDNPAFHYL